MYTESKRDANTSGAQLQKEVLINLQESSNTRIFGDSNLIHLSEFNKVQDWIKKNIEKIEAIEKSDNFKERWQNTISILGSRGSGKSTFLLSLLNVYKNDKDKGRDIEVLDIIDPTLFEEKGHVFLTIISLIKELVMVKLNFGGCNPGCPEYGKKEVWRSKLQSLSHGLPSIDGIDCSDNGSWQDPDYIMDKGLRAVHSAKKLEEHFHEFVKMSLDILGKRAFLISFDDIDINFKKGWPVLETLRKYLTTPRIITLISGDIDLYSKAIRKQQWKNFGKALLINEAEKQYKYPEYNDLVTEMEGQYLQKVLKPERRIHLNTLLEKISTEKIRINVQTNKETDSPIFIKDLYKRDLMEFGIQSTSQAETFISFLMSLPLRTQIQFLLQFDNLFPGELAEVTDPFLSDLYEKEVNVELAKSMPQLLNVIVLKLLLKDQVISEAYQLQPTTSDLSLNSALTALSLLFAQKVKKNPELIFDYFIKIGYIRNLYSLLGYEDKNKGKIGTDKSPSINELCKHAELYQDKVLRDVTANITAYLRGFLNYSTNRNENLLPKAGVVIIKGLNSFAKGKKPEGRIDYVFGNEVTPESCIAYIPLSLSSSNTKNSTLATYSIYGLLATLNDLIKERKSMKTALLNFSQIRSYVMPNFKQDRVENNQDFDDIDVSDESRITKPEDISALEGCINKWIDDFPEEKGISPYLLGKISTRFFYGLDNIEKGKSTSNLGEEMEKRIIALFNAILVEDVKENYTRESFDGKTTISNLNLNNTLTFSTILTDNIKTGKQLHGNFTFSKWMMVCPLFLFFLPKSLLDNIQSYNEIKDIELIKRYNVYDKLKNVDIRRNDEEDEKGNDKTEPKFSGDKRYVLKTVEVLLKNDPQSYSVIKTKDIDIIKAKYGHLFSNTISISSIDSLLKKITDSTKDPLVVEWTHPVN